MPPLRGSVPLEQEEYELLSSGENNSNNFVDKEQGRYVDTYYSLWSASGLAAFWGPRKIHVNPSLLLSEGKKLMRQAGIELSSAFLEALILDNWI
ncbi:MAG: hypothetical protein CM1200mP12_22050 [Gammaproteobacteria bacterium]|nr:MAG: hypothetical protein CM1200mP12_22050 [Gammaproteobacteria bacterium]